jgi:DNA-binding winged helix-turn-helix (wHTH) protein
MALGLVLHSLPALPAGTQMAANDGTIRFGFFEVDLRTEELRKHAKRLRLPRQSYQVLVLLLRRPGDLVTRDELRERLWPANTFVDFDHGLNAAVNRLRTVLGDSAEEPRLIETLSRRGYRFIASIEAVSADTSHSNSVRQVSAGHVSGPEVDVVAVQRARSETVRTHIGAGLRIQTNIGSRSTVNVNREAHDHYLKGLHHWHKHTAGNWAKAVDWFRRSTDLDPSFAPAFAGLAYSTYSLAALRGGTIALGEYLTIKDATARAGPRPESRRSARD